MSTNPILVGDPAMAILAARYEAERTPHPPEDYPAYTHGERCRRQGVTPQWRLVDGESTVWTRRCDQLYCGVGQFWSPPMPAQPPMPDATALASWKHSRDEHQCPNVIPVLAPFEFEITDRARGMGHWWTRCRVCGAVRHFVAEARRHYEGLGVVTPPERPRGFSLDELGATR